MYAHPLRVLVAVLAHLVALVMVVAECPGGYFDCGSNDAAGME